MEGFEEKVTVTGETIRAAGIDTQVFRLDEGPTQSTGTMLDALKNVPGVTVDQEGKVSLRGSDQVAILIDGRQSSLTGFGSQRGLDSVSAANIEAIEIINNPSARFDAAGMAGIINIIYKKEQQLGWSGDVGLGLGVGQFTKQRRDLPTDLGSFSNNEKIIPSVNLNYRTPRTRTFVQGELLLQDDLPNNEFTTRFYDDGRVIESQVPENREQYRLHRPGRIRLSPSTTRTPSPSRASTTTSTTSTSRRCRSSSRRRASASGSGSGGRDEGTGFTNANVDFTHKFGAPGHELGVNLQFTRGKEDEAYFLNEESPIRIGTDNTHIIAIENTLPLSIDYTRPLPTGRLELGTKLQRRWIPVTYTVRRGVQSVIYPGLGDFSDWDENIFAGYANLVRIKPRYTLEGGLRLEQTQVSYTIPAENIYYPGSDQVRLLRRVPEREAHAEPDERQPAHRGLQPARRPSRRAGAAHLPEVRRSGAAESGEPVPAAAVHQRVRSRDSRARGPGARAAPPSTTATSAMRSCGSSRSTTRIPTTTSSTASSRTPATSARPACS